MLGLRFGKCLRFMINERELGRRWKVRRGTGSSDVDYVV